jgi:hypothetical protein
VTFVTPTGGSPLAGDTAIVPNIGFWNNIAGGWVIRGGFGVNIPVDGRNTDSLINQFAMGQTVTPNDFPLFGIAFALGQ